MAWTSPRTWLAGEKPSAAIYNQHIRDNFNAIGNQWQAYAPVWAAATTNPVIGNGTLIGNYIQAGKLVMFRVRIVMGSTTTFGSGVYTISLPVTALMIQNPGLIGWWKDAAPTIVPYPMTGESTTTGNFRMIPSSSTTYSNPTFPITLAVNDEINMGGFYEAA